MRVEISGHTPAAAHLAILMSEGPFQVTWNKKEQPCDFRPLRLSARTIKSIKRLSARLGGDCSKILMAPHQGAWRTASSKAFRFSFDIFENDFCRWVDPSAVMPLLTQLALRSNVNVRDTAEYSMPEESIGHIHIVDAHASDLSHWPQSFFSIDNDSFQVECTQISFPFGRIENHGDAFFFALEGALVFLEPTGTQGYVLSLISGSRYSTERATRSILSAAKGIPIFLKTLALMNAGAKRLDFRTEYGSPRLTHPKAFTLGSSFGLYPESININGDESIRQSLRLAGFLRQALREKLSLSLMREYWQNQETRHYQKTFSKARLWEKIMYSSKVQKLVLPTIRWIPGRVRQYLKAPF
jgi:hypothetical protein